MRLLGICEAGLAPPQEDETHKKSRQTYLRQTVPI